MPLSQRRETAYEKTHPTFSKPLDEKSEWHMKPKGKRSIWYGGRNTPIGSQVRREGDIDGNVNWIKWVSIIAGVGILLVAILTWVV